jgi:hypothetical protein
MRQRPPEILESPGQRAALPLGDRTAMVKATLTLHYIVKTTTYPAETQDERSSFGQHLAQVVLINDQQPDEDLMVKGTGGPFADHVGPHRQLHPIQMTGTDVSG